MLWLIAVYLLVAAGFYGYLIATAMADPYETQIQPGYKPVKTSYKRLSTVAKF
jgi:hypothetical protein